MRSLQGERAIKDASSGSRPGASGPRTLPPSVDREKLGQQLLVRLARDILRDVIHQVVESGSLGLPAE